VNWKTLIYPLAIASCLFFARVTAQGRPLCPTPKDRAPALIAVISRSQPGFTEGLLWHDGNLIESTGAYGGTSMINQIDPRTGTVSPLLATPDDSFGEGLTFIENHFAQLTWKDNVVFDYTTALQLDQRLPFPHEGWGLTNDGTHLIFSNGSSQITFVDPSNLQTRRTIVVQDREGNLYTRLNALSYANSALYSNVFQTDQLLKTDPVSGCVLTRYDLNSLRDNLDSKDLAEISKDPLNDVFNGIAYDPDDKSFYLTGKNWGKIFKVKLPD
jgi:glutaminyl-peptide cyclotransferase